jgi:glycosyl transferase family 25
MPIPIYVLSLVDAAERRRAVHAEFVRHGLDFHFVDAVDSRSIAEADLHLHYDGTLNARNFKRPLARGEIACALGHRAIWKKIAEGPAPVALVCEDDALLSPGFGRFLRWVALRESAFADTMIKLDSPARAGQVVARLADVDLVLPRRLPSLTTGYLLGRNAAAALLAREGKISRPIDIDLKHYWEHRVPILVVQPQLVSSRPGIESSIEVSRAAAKPGVLWHRLSRNLRYQWAIGLERLRFPLRVDRIPVLFEMRKLFADPE